MFLTPKGTTCAHLQLLPVSPSPSPWQPRICVLSLRIYLLWVFHINEIIRPVTYLSDVSPLAVCFEDVPILPSCSWLNSIPSCDGPHWFCPFIRRGMLFSAFRLLWLALLGIFRDKFLFEYLLWVLSGRLGLLGAIVALCLPFWAVVKVAHSGGAILRSRQLWMRAPFLSHPCQRLLVSSSSTFFFFLIIGTLVGVRWYETVGFLRVSLMITGYRASLPVLAGHSEVFFGDMSTQGLCPFFWLSYLSFCCQAVGVFVHSGCQILTPYISFANIFPIL